MLERLIISSLTKIVQYCLINFKDFEFVKRLTYMSKSIETNRYHFWYMGVPQA